MMCRRLALALSLISSLTASQTSHAYIAIRSAQSGAEVRWGEGAQLTFRTNTVNASGMSAQDIFTLFTTSLNRWKQAAHEAFGFTYYQGTDNSKYPNHVSSPYDNSIFFTSNASNSADRLACGVIALTQVWFDPGSGIASKADLRFNDLCYTFTTNPTDTKSQTRIYLGDVATHELGHAMGLDHSQNLQSSMIYTASLEMSRPSCDDEAAMTQLYSSATRARTGSLSGSIVSPSGSAIFGAHVQAFQLERGTVMAATLSDKDGHFTIGGLEPGTYGVMVEPYYPGAASLSTYYASISSSVCGGSNFNRTFMSASGKLQAFFVPAGGGANAGTVSVSCSAPASINSSQENSFAAAPTLAAGNLAAPVATQGVFSSSNDHYYLLAGQSGHLSVQALSFSLFSRADVQVELLSQSGVRLSQTTSANVFSSLSSGYANYDASASAELAVAQDVYVHVFTRYTLSTSPFPSGSVGVSNTPYYVLTVSRGQQSPVFPLNARCANEDSFGAYTPQGDAPSFGGGSSDDDSGSSGCGTIRGTNSGDNDPMGPGSLIRMANFAVLCLMLVYARRRFAFI